MYSQVLQSIDGIGIYPVFSLIIFVLFFSIVITWLVKLDKKYVSRMQQLPLEMRDTVKTITGDYNEKN